MDQYDFADTDYMDENEDDFSPLIGQYLITFSFLEHQIDQMLAEIINERSDETGYLVTANMSMFNKIDLLQRFMELAVSHDVKQPNKFTPLLKRVKAANTIRNRIAHANWSSMKSDGTVRVGISVSEEAGVNFVNIKLGIEELSDAQDELDAVISELDELEFYEV